jgi:hypothetical protein
MGRFQLELIYLSSNQCNSMFLAPATESEIMNIIKNMKIKKSSGTDEIPDCIIKAIFQRKSV